MSEEKKTNVVPIVISLAFVLLLSVGLYFLISNNDTKTPEKEINLEEETEVEKLQDFEELTFNIITPGTGAQTVLGDMVSVHYEGTLIDGTKFDSSYDRGTPYEFTLGNGEVIEGWEKGVLGMKVGEVRELKIPSSMGYGEYGAGSTIPGGAGLIFKVELLGIK
jgi:FKBP-type peptidyl-prolyl cis-trans isomerase